MASIAGIQDFRREGPPGDIGTFQMSCSALVFQFTFSGTTYIVAMRAGASGWVLITVGTIVQAGVVLNAAIAALTTGDVFIARGTYGLTAASGPMIIKSYIRLFGEGKATIIQLEDNANCNIIQSADATTCQYAELHDLFLNGRKANNASGKGLRLFGGFRCYFTNIFIYEMKEEGLELLGDAGHPNYDNFFEALWLMYSDSDGLRIRDYCTDCYFDIIEAGDCGGDGVHIEGAAATCAGHDFQVVHTWGNASDGLHIGPWGGVSYARVYAEFNDIHGVYISWSNYNHIVGRCWNNSVSGAGLGDGVRLADSNHCKIDVLAYDTRGGGSLQDYGVKETGASDYNIVVANILGPNRTGPALIIGANTEYAHCIIA